MGGWRRRSTLVATLLLGVGTPGIGRAQSTAPPEQVPGSVLVHIESPDPVDLQRETGDRRDPFYVACRSPCDEWVPATGRYRIAGSGTRASRRFELLASSGRETVVVSPASSTGFGIGIGAMAVGVASAGLGAFALLASSLSDDPNASSGNGAVNWALGLIVGGLFAEAGGVTLVVLNARSHVDQSTAAGARLESSSGRLASDAARRMAPIPRCPSATTWPLLRLAF